MQTQDLILDQGATWHRVFAVSNGLDMPTDITGYGVRAQLRRYYNAPTIDAEFTGAVVDPVSRSISIHYAASLSELVEPASYVYDVQIFTMYGDEEIVYRTHGGPVQVTPCVTRGGHGSSSAGSTLDQDFVLDQSLLG